MGTVLRPAGRSECEEKALAAGNGCAAGPSGATGVGQRQGCTGMLCCCDAL